MSLVALPLGAISTWVTPIWLLGIGAGVGLVLILVGSALIAALSRKGGAAILLGVREGILLPILLTVTLMAAIGVMSTALVRHPGRLVSSLTRVASVGEETLTFTINASPPVEYEEDIPRQQIDLRFRRSELDKIEFTAPQDLLISEPGAGEGDEVAASDSEPRPAEFRHTGGEKTVWSSRHGATNPFSQERVEGLQIANLGGGPTELKILLQTDIRYPEVKAIPITAASVVIIFLLYFLQRTWMPKMSAIALATSKSEVAQPLFFVVLAIGLFALLLFIFIPYNTFGEDVKMLKDSGLMLIMFLSILIAVWGAGTSVADEIEGRTALTVLSKPIGRPQFILGKFLGIVWTVALMFLVLGLPFLMTISYKLVYDARETAETDPTWQACHLEMVRTVPGLLLAFMETVVMTSLAIAIATRLPLLANFVISFSIYVLGHLTPLIVNSSLGDFAPVAFIGQLIATVVPVLDHFNIQAAVAAGVSVPYQYLLWTLVYCILYSSIAMLLALTMFEDRDLA